MARWHPVLALVMATGVVLIWTVPRSASGITQAFLLQSCGPVL